MCCAYDVWIPTKSTNMNMFVSYNKIQCERCVVNNNETKTGIKQNFRAHKTKRVFETAKQLQIFADRFSIYRTFLPRMPRIKLISFRPKVAIYKIFGSAPGIKVHSIKERN